MGAFDMSLGQLALLVHGELRGDETSFCGAAIDTRVLRARELFVAFSGEYVDGHDFVSQARTSGAAAALVEHFVDDVLPQLKVSSTRQALGEFAAVWRQKFNGKLVALTGSNGKTSVKEILSSILATRGKVLATRGNLNNDIGMPLTLSGLRAEHDYAVVEMGANHPGEINYLSHIAQPDVAIITNAGPAHLEGFGSVAGVAQAKGEIINGLSEGGVCVLNADDKYFPVWREMAGSRRIVSFGMQQSADVRAVKNKPGHLSMTCFGESLEAPFTLLGQHNVMNALAACAAAHVVGLNGAELVRGLSAVKPVAGRLQPKPGLSGAVVIDDTYNANPDSLKAAIDVLSASEGETRVLVLGDMAELGAESRRLHAEFGAHAKNAGVDRLLTLGDLSAAAVPIFGEGGMAFSHEDALLGALKDLMHESCVVLVKGSRSAHMETVVNAICKAVD